MTSMGDSLSSHPVDVTLQKILDAKREDLAGIAVDPASRSWLAPCADSEQGTQKLLEELERRVDSDDFVAKIDEERHRFVSLPSDLAQGSEVLQAEWWEPVSSPTSGGLVPEVTGDYVLVNHEDMINAVAVFLAAYISSLPEGKSLESKQLQRAVQQALREIRKGRVRKLWDWGRWVYRAAALSYGAFAAYTNPWVAEAVFKALFTFARFARTFW